MRGKRLQARRLKLQALAALDRAHRCAYCKRALADTGRWVRVGATGEPKTYCSEDCLDTDLALEQGVERIH